MSILGLTIDYGPYGFLDKFDPMWTPNLTDFEGRRCVKASHLLLSTFGYRRREDTSLCTPCLQPCDKAAAVILQSVVMSVSCRYCYKGQIEAVQWNLAQFATALLAVDLVSQEQAQAAVNHYGEHILQLHNQGMAQKLGLSVYDESLVTSFLRLMYTSEADFTNSFRALSNIPAQDEFQSIPELLLRALGKAPDDDQKQVRCYRLPVMHCQARCMLQTPDSNQLTLCPHTTIRKVQMLVNSCRSGCNG